MGEWDYRQLLHPELHRLEYLVHQREPRSPQHCWSQRGPALISDDIYLDIKFTSWSGSSGGGFAYLRSTPPLVPEPAARLLILTGLAGVGSFRVLKRRRVEVAVTPENFYSIL